ncbi:TIGR01619 family protein [Caviibacterium pharyngocola]|uniref:TIGR01619 family protein n=1 Tax=Caviibacterium pharyngocola TaxID=28159 RepID=A0A2M8RWV1_9PAST|nr:TIGR01619 family protein [Caviibacterium pharyngocola]PJG83351.1 TIGR01619 family protein [Caviibacterium pharyngocola]
MDLDQHWQHYRSVINEKPAIFAVNWALCEKYDEGVTQDKIAQFSLPYRGEENGFPSEKTYQRITKDLVKITGLLATLPDLLYAGYMVSDNQVKLHFYCQDSSALLEVLQQFPQVEQIDVQEDPHWETYFDFLLPSPLEVKINATDELLEMLQQNGRNLADIYALEHNFHFSDEESMYGFLDYIHSTDIPVSDLKHSEEAFPIDEDEEMFIVKLEQEITLDTPDIFTFVEHFEQAANQFEGEYIGWETQELQPEKRQIN